jgi:ubiquinol-cytochrome c reductase cytochrome c subunit
MVTGPQSMPMFSDTTITPDDKRAIIAYIAELQNSSSPGGLDLGRIGPVTETVFLFTAVAAALAFAAIWIGMKAR